MDPTHATPVQNLGDSPLTTGAELILQNGRLKGTRRPILLPMILIGRMENCDIRLNVDGISPLQCVLVHGPHGFLLRDLPGTGATLVNGVPVLTHLLRNGDQLTVGPFQFEFHCPAAAATANPGTDPESSALQEALRIQAAAVAAQQAALTEEEARLQQQRVALLQQEGQLATHLEEKRCRLQELQTQVQEARATLRAERAAHQTQVSESTRGLAEARRAADESHRQAQAERQCLIDLRKRLKRRWHRHWFAERQAMQRRETQLASRFGQLKKVEEQLQRQQATLERNRLRCNADAELGRRQLQATADVLRQKQHKLEQERNRQQADLNEFRRALDQQQVALSRAARELAAERKHWQTTRRHLQREAEGLENRIRNYRHIRQHQEVEVNRLQGILTVQASVSLPARSPVRPAERLGNSADPADQPIPQPVPMQAIALHITKPEAGLVDRLTLVEKLARALADQRLYLVEQSQRFVVAQQQLQQERALAVAELEALALRLQEWEQGLVAQRENVLEPVEYRLRQKKDEMAQLKRYLEAWQSRLEIRSIVWQSERDRLLLEVQLREQLVEQRLEAIEELQRSWTQSRAEDTERLAAEKAVYEELRRECVILRQDWLDRGAALENERHALAERTLALEQLRQEYVGQAANGPAAEKRLEKLRRRWAALSTDALRTIRRERQALEARAASLEDRFRLVQQQAARLAAGEAELFRRQTAWQKHQVQAEAEQVRLQHQLASVQALRVRYERQIGDLQDEVERLARLFIDEPDTPALPDVQAA